jgi:hypothetical protein
MSPADHIRLWNDRDTIQSCHVGRQTPIPRGSKEIPCPKCHARAVIAAIIVRDNGDRVIASSDDQDPELLCMQCGYWWD